MTRPLILSLIIIIFLVSCKNSGDNDILELWSSNNAQEISLTEEFVEQWNMDNPGKPLRFQPIPEGESSEEIVLASVVGKTTPDIYANMRQANVEMYAKAGVLVPLDTLDGFMDFLSSRCAREVIDEITSYDGHIYQVPWKVNPIIMLYNKGILDTLEIEGLPLTYSKYLEAARLFRKDVNGDGYIDRWIGYTSVKVIWYQRLFNFYPLYLAASDGARLISDNKAAFNNEHAIGVFRFLNKLYNEEYFARQRMSASQDPFIMQRYATLITGPWQVPYLEKYKPAHMEYDFFPMLVPDDHEGPSYTYGDPKNIVIFNTCTDPQLAWEFINTMITKHGDLRLMEITGQFPRRKNLASDPYFTEFLENNPKLVVFANQVDYIKGLDNHELIVEVMDIISQEYEACVIYNRKTPEQAIADAEKAVNILLGNI
jgi:multiple sugar transport system substrate-binding protein